MIHVECMHFHPKTFKKLNNINKSFADVVEFNEFYSLAKEDPNVVVKIMYYDPYKFSIKKDIYDAKLLSLEKSNPV